MLKRFYQGNSVQIQSFGDALKITAPSHLVEKMLQTRLYKYQHITKTNMHAIRQSGGFTIPSEVADKIYMITGLTMFPFVRKDLKHNAYISAKPGDVARAVRYVDFFLR